MKIFHYAIIITLSASGADLDKWHVRHMNQKFDQEQCLQKENGICLDSFAERIALIERKKVKRELVCATLLGAAASFPAYWGYRNVVTNPAHQPRLGPIGMAALPLAKDFAGPVIACACMAYLYWDIKNAFVEPYRKAHKAEIDKFHDALGTHKKEMHDKYEEAMKETGRATRQISLALDHIDLIKRQFEELHNTVNDTQDTNKKIKEALAKITPTIITMQESVKKLSENSVQQAAVMKKYASHSLRRALDGTPPAGTGKKGGFSLFGRRRDKVTPNTPNVQV